MKKLVHFSSFLILLLCCSGCAKKDKKINVIKKEEQKVPVSSVVALRQFKASVDGVECELCAQDVIAMFKEIDDVDYVDFQLKDDEYEQGHIRFCYDIGKQNLDIKKVDQRLMQDGFQLASLEGSFAVTPLQRAGKLYVMLQDDTILPLSPESDKAATQQLMHRQSGLTLVQGTVIKDLESGAMSFVVSR